MLSHIHDSPKKSAWEAITVPTRTNSNPPSEASRSEVKFPSIFEEGHCRGERRDILNNTASVGCRS